MPYHVIRGKFLEAEISVSPTARSLLQMNPFGKRSWGQPDPFCCGGRPVMVDKKKQVVTAWGDVPVWWRSGTDRGRCPAGNHAADIALILIEGVGHRPGAHEHDFRDRARRGCGNRECRPVSDCGWRASDRRT